MRNKKERNDAKLELFILASNNYYNGIKYINIAWKIIIINSSNKIKRKKDSNGMVESSKLIPDYDNYKDEKYLNVS